MKELDFRFDLKAKPFLRWAGGKSWLTKYLVNLRTTPFNDYHEAFLGGAATYFYLRPKNHSFLSDLNGELIETYQAVKDNVEGVIEVLSQFKNDEQSYYEIRAKKFDSLTEKAGRFIYLNQTSYNGLHRVNGKGQFNVPYGFRTKDFINRETLRSASLALSNTTLFQADFMDVIGNLKANDLVFLDPPYTVSHNNNGFIKYNEKIFSLNDQVRLSEMIELIKARNSFYILTNAAHLTIDEIFNKNDTKLELTRGNGIGGKSATRGQTSEYVFTNIKL